MKTISLDVHAELSQLSVVSEHGEVLLEMQVPTRAGDLRRIVSGVPGRKRVVMEHGPMSGLIHPERPGVSGEALDDLADEIVSADPARNALIAKSEDSNDERDAQRLGVLDRAGALHKVYVPEEPYRTFRSLVKYDRVLQRSTSATMLRRGVRTLRWSRPSGHESALPQVRGRMSRQGDLPRADAEGFHQADSERLAPVADAKPRPPTRCVQDRARKGLADDREALAEDSRGREARDYSRHRKRCGPDARGVDRRAAPGLRVDPTRFKSRSAVGSYGGLGISQGITNCLPGVRQGSGWGAPAHRDARTSGPPAERTVRAATARSALRPAFGQAGAVHRYGGGDQRKQRSSSAIRGAHSRRLGAAQGREGHRAEDPRDRLRGHAYRKGIRRWASERAGTPRRPFVTAPAASGARKDPPAAALREDMRSRIGFRLGAGRDPSTRWPSRPMG